MTPQNSQILNALTIDVEEHFQVSAFDGVVDRGDWATMTSRVETSTERILDLLDEAGVSATFFVLGWLAEHRRQLVRRIAERGHEIGCHGYSHRLVYEQRAEEFVDEVRRSKQLLEQISGQEVRGHRAASFSITRQSLWALDALVDAGFAYDSSLFPVRHDRYGIPGAPRGIYRLETPSGRSLLEISPSTLQLGRFALPIGGGGYLRLYPYALTRWALRRLNRAEGMPAVVYLHPWEADPAQPRIRAPWKSRLRHYSGLRTTLPKLRRLLRDFAFGPAGQVVGTEADIPEQKVS